MKISCGMPKLVSLTQASQPRCVSSSVIERACEITRAVPASTPPMASVAMKEGMRSRTWARPPARPASPPTATASTMLP